MRKPLESKEVEERDAQAVQRGERDRNEHAMPAGGDHRVKGQVTEGVQVALRARRKEVLPQAPVEELERRVVVIVEQVPVKVLAGDERPERAHESAGAEGRHGNRSRHGRQCSRWTRLTRCSTASAAARLPLAR